MAQESTGEGRSEQETGQGTPRRSLGGPGEGGSEQETGQGTAVARRDEPGGGPLESERGTTVIADSVVTKVAGIAAREIPGIYDMGGGAARALGSVTQRVGIGDERTQGVSVEVGQREAAIDLSVVIEYGESMPDTARAVRENVINRIEGLCGLAVTEVNVVVNDLHFPGDDVEDESRQPRVA